MSRLFPSVPLVRYISDELPRDAYDHNLIVVGGPGVPGSQGNRLVSTLQRRLGIGVGYSTDAMRLVMPDGQEFAGEFDDAGRCTLTSCSTTRSSPSSGGSPSGFGSALWK